MKSLSEPLAEVINHAILSAVHQAAPQTAAPFVQPLSGSIGVRQQDIGALRHFFPSSEEELSANCSPGAGRSGDCWYTLLIQLHTRQELPN